MKAFVLCLGLSSLVLCLRAEETVDPSAPIVFALAKPAKFQAFRTSARAEIRFYGQKTEYIRYSVMREIFPLEFNAENLATNAKVVYGEATLNSNIPGVDSATFPVDQKAYLVARKGDGLSATTVDQKKLPEQEEQFLFKNVIQISERHVLETTLHGQQLSFGDPLKNADAVFDILKERLGNIGVGDVKNCEARLMMRHRYQDRDTAIFMLKMETVPSKIFKGQNLTLTGQMVVEIPSGRPVAIKLDGPVTVYGASSEEPMRQGVLSVEMLSQVTYPPESKQNETRREHDHLIVPGRSGIYRGGRVR